LRRQHGNLPNTLSLYVLLADGYARALYEQNWKLAIILYARIIAARVLSHAWGM